MIGTKGPWRQGVPPYEVENQIFGVDEQDGSKQLVAEVFGHTIEQVRQNVAAILAASNNRERLSTMRTP